MSDENRIDDPMHEHDHGVAIEATGHETPMNEVLNGTNAARDPELTISDLEQAAFESGDFANDDLNLDSSQAISVDGIPAEATSTFMSVDSTTEAKPVAAVQAISVRGLIKNYGGLRAVDGVSFDVPVGEFFGFLGPNGAGKTTTINALTGLVKFNEGTIEIFGYDVVSQWRQARALIGLAPQEYNFDRYLSIRDVLIVQAGYYGLKPAQVRGRADELLERFGLADKAKETYTKLSGGMKRRLTLARALIHSPRLLILDEPTAGVDIELRIELWQFLRELNASGMTILLTTHYLEEAEELCRRIGIIESGKIVALDATEKLLAGNGEPALTVTLDRPLRTLPVELNGPNARFTPGSRKVVFENVSPAGLSRVLFLLENMGLIIEDVSFDRPSLQEVFLQLTQRGAQ